MSQVAHQARAYPGFCSMKWLEIFLLPLDGMLVHRKVAPSINLTITQLYTWVDGGIVILSKVSCPRTQHNFPGQGPDHSIQSWVH